MRLFENLDAFKAQLGSVKKWMRTAQALEAAPSLVPGVAYSIGDSLTYWCRSASELSQDAFVGSRRYLCVLSPMSQDLELEIAPKGQLHTVQPYSDVSDREFFSGMGEKVVLSQGSICVLEEDEAYRVPQQVTPDSSVVVVRVTVEGYSFPNK